MPENKARACTHACAHQESRAAPAGSVPVRDRAVFVPAAVRGVLRAGGFCSFTENLALLCIFSYEFQNQFFRWYFNQFQQDFDWLLLLVAYTSGSGPLSDAVFSTGSLALLSS